MRTNGLRSQPRRRPDAMAMGILVGGAVEVGRPACRRVSQTDEGDGATLTEKIDNDRFKGR